MFRIIKDLDIKFMSMTKPPLFISAILLVVSLISISIKGFNFGIDFSSGYIVQLKFDKQVTVLEIQNKLANNGLNDLSVQLYGSSSDILIKLKDEETFQKTNINNQLIEIFDNDKFEIIKLEYVGAQVGSELRERENGLC